MDRVSQTLCSMVRDTDRAVSSVGPRFIVSSERLWIGVWTQKTAREKSAEISEGTPRNATPRNVLDERKSFFCFCFQLFDFVDDLFFGEHC